jgi:hypothetical protein
MASVGLVVAVAVVAVGRAGCGFTVNGIRSWGNITADLAHGVPRENPSWPDSRPQLQPMIDSGQIQIANHTWEHPDVRTLSSTQLIDQLDRNNRYVQKLCGWIPGLPRYMGHTTARPDLRSPGLLGDQLVEQVLHRDQSGPERQNTTQCLRGGSIVIGHANFPAMTRVYDDIIALIQTDKQPQNGNPK